MYNISVSNLAWSNINQKEVLAFLKEKEINHIELAPIKIFGKNNEIKIANVENFKKNLDDFNIKISAIQGIFYLENFNIFKKDEHDIIIRKFKKIALISKILEVKTIVFGSPKNRFIKNKEENYLKTAKSFFNKISKILLEYDLLLGIENNPEEYGCNFLNNVDEINKFNDLIKFENIGLNFDTGGIIIKNESILDNLKKTKKLFNFHVSEPYLASFNNEEKHFGVREYLKKIKYEKFVSLEMIEPDNFYTFEQSILKFIKLYK